MRKREVIQLCAPQLTALSAANLLRGHYRTGMIAPAARNAKCSAHLSAQSNTCDATTLF